MSMSRPCSFTTAAAAADGAALLLVVMLLSLVHTGVEVDKKSLSTVCRQHVLATISRRQRRLRLRCGRAISERSWSRLFVVGTWASCCCLLHLSAFSRSSSSSCFSRRSSSLRDVILTWSPLPCFTHYTRHHNSINNNDNNNYNNNNNNNNKLYNL